MADSMPVLFIGHGNPMNSLLNNNFTRGWAATAASIRRPRAVLCISAHWYISRTSVTAEARPKTIHDFSGFPQELFEVQYPAPGAPEIAARVETLLTPTPVHKDEDWGLDHGTWSILTHMYPKADIPVVQLSINRDQPAAFHFEIGKRLAPLRDEGILILGSGNIVHNLRAYAWGQENIEPYDWAVSFEHHVRESLAAGETGPLVAYESFGREATLAAPTPDHYLPLLYVVGARRPGESAQFPVEGMDGGSISMLAVRIG